MDINKIGANANEECAAAIQALKNIVETSFDNRQNAKSQFEILYKSFASLKREGCEKDILVYCEFIS
jgi:ribulose kinase